MAKEFVDFKENEDRMRTKSVSIRKYHVLNIINDIAPQIGYYNRQNIRVFALINEVLPEVDDGRQRIISVKFMLRQIFRVLRLEFKYTPISK